MSRLIDADALKLKLEDSHDFFVDAWHGFANMPPNDKARVDEINMCIARVVNAPTIEVPTWIPCSKRLPSEKDYIGDVVIWCTDKSMVGVGWYYESTESWATIDDTFPPILGEVIAWMPLPKPYEEIDHE